MRPPFPFRNLVALALFFGALLGLNALVVRSYLGEVALLRTGAHVTGAVTEHFRSQSKYVISYEFSANGLWRNTVTVTRKTYDALDGSAEIDILYLRNDPRTNAPAASVSRRSLVFGGALILLLTGMFWGVPLWALLRRRHSSSNATDPTGIDKE